jgi:uncharacterized protein YbjT (DUF2867 family)
MKVILFGASGMVGRGALRECLLDPEVEAVLAIGRSASGEQHPKLKELVQQDVGDLAMLEHVLKDYDACLFCLGVSAAGMSEQDYRRVTYDLTLRVAQTLERLNPKMTFVYVSGGGTDSTEKGLSMWARVKGATENALLAMFRHAYMFRPHGMQAMPGQRNLPRAYKLLFWIFPPLIALMPNAFCTLRDLARAMIAVATKGDATRVLEVKDIVRVGRG